MALHDEISSSRKVPGEPGIWVFVFGDMIVFSLFFIIFLYYREQNVELFSASQTHLNQNLGVLNTFLMLSSSWFVATAIHAARKKQDRSVPILFMLGFLCGVGFAIVKFFEYRDKIRAGITLTTNDFFMYYYIFTGIHLLHVTIGMGVLALMARYTHTVRPENRRMAILESGASFWHLVDLLWIVLFALLYLVR